MRKLASARWMEGAGAPVIAAIVLLGAALTLAIGDRLLRYERAEAQREAQIGADEISSAIQRRIQAHAEVLYGLSGLFNTADGAISRQQFRRYVERWDPRVRLGAVQAVQFVRYLPPGAVAGHEQRMRADAPFGDAWRAAFRIQPLLPDSAHYVIDYTEPLSGNEKVLGFNLASRPTHRAALERGRDSGQLVATERVNLLQDPSGAPAFVMRLPVYRGDGLPADVEQRRAALLGFVAVVYRVGNLLEGLIDSSVTARMRIVIHDAGFDDERTKSWQPDAASLMYDSERGRAELDGEETLRRTLEVGGRRWYVYLLPKPGANKSSQTPMLIVGASGALVTLLAATLAVAWARSRAHARRLGALSVEQSLVFDNALAGIVQVRRHQIHRCNERFAAILGYARQELIARAAAELFPTPQAHADFEQRARGLQQAGKTMEFELALRARDGRAVWCAVHGKTHHVDGQRESIWVIEDLSEQRAHAAQLAAQHAAVAQANQELQLSVARLSEQKRLVELLGTMSTALQSCHRSDEIADVLVKSFEALRNDIGGALYLLDTSTGLLQISRQWGVHAFEQQGFAPQDCWALRRSRPHWGQGLALRCAHCADLGGVLCLPLLAMNEQLGLLCLARGDEGEELDQALQTVILAATEQVAVTLVNLRMRERLHDQAIRDKLTGLCNRRFLDESLLRELARSRREASSLALLLIDVDHFKQFNDRHGHELGDQVLAAVGRCLASQTRATDLPCRYGGEEFVVAMPRSSLDDAAQRAEVLRLAIAAIPLSVAGESLRITASIGVACFPQHGPDPAALLAAADAALYEAKRSGRNQVRKAG